MGIIIAILIGAVAGWLAGKIMRGGGFGFIINAILGIAGSFVGNWLFGFLGISIGGKWVGAIISALVGAIVILFIVSLFAKKK